MSETRPTNISLYGKGVFTTLAFIDFQPFLWDKHWGRLAANAAKLGIDISNHREQAVEDSISTSIREKNFSTGRIRITFIDESPSSFWDEDSAFQTSRSIVVGERRAVPPEFRLTVSPHLVNSTSPLAGIKSCNYLEPLMAYDEAKSRGFAEAVRLNERGEVTSACMANVFWLKGGRLFTPSLTTGCLAGTTREYILENIECREVEAGIEAIREADEIFLTSAGIGVVALAAFDDKELKSTGHPITKVLPF